MSKETRSTLYQCNRGYQGDFNNYVAGEIVEVVEIHAKTYEPSLIFFKGRTGFIDTLEAEEFNKRFLHDSKVPPIKDRDRMNQLRYDQQNRQAH